jgi:protein-disulfide isomerase/uncharacterized membrane protein
LALSALGLVLSLVVLYVHWQLATGGDGYTSFCNVSDQVNCDVVLASHYATFLGVPVAAWSALTYVLIGVLARAGLPWAPLALLAVVGWATGYSIVMGVISLGVLGAVCLMCTGLYVVNACLFAAAIAHAAGRAGPRAAIAVAALPFLVAVAAGTGEAWRIAPSATTPGNLADAAGKDPEFTRWYRGLPVVAEARRLPDPAHAKGSPDAPVTIVEFSDFSCQHCARASRDLERLVAARPAEVRLVFRHFPLDPTCNPAVRRAVHPAACAAATAAECAGEAGRFWEFHDYLFAHQDTEDFVHMATLLGLDATRFRECIASGRGRAAVTRDAADGAGFGVDSTPTLFINGRTVRGALSPSLYEFVLAIEHRGPDDGHGS